MAAQCGVTNLARRLNALLVDHIRALLPGLRRAVNDALEVKGQEKMELCKTAGSTAWQRPLLLVNIQCLGSLGSDCASFR